jgi:hypothetical protein
MKSVSSMPLMIAVLFISLVIGRESRAEDVGSRTITTARFKVTGAELIACGEIDAEPSIAQQDEPQTVMGHVNVMDELETPRFKPGCPHIRARMGTRFGLSIQLDGQPDGAVVSEVSTRVSHPAMKNPVTQDLSTQSEWQSPMNIGYARFAGWQFEEPWELVAGAWKIEILYRGEVLVSKDFKVEVN